MKLINILVFSVFLTFFISGCASNQSAKLAGEERHDVIYTCDCGPQCNCNTVDVKPGKCKCGVPLKWGHVLKVEGNEAIVCQCAEGCKCGGLDPKDPSKCLCGQKVKRVNLEGSGVHFCNCGGSCYCNTVSDEPGECKCGMKLKKAS